MFDIELYSLEKQVIWNNFVNDSKNGTFLFNRNYMDYHSDRFQDCSAMVYRKGQLYCMFPANREEDVLWSHHGLTYGGMIMNSKVTVSELLEVWALMNHFYREQGIRKVIYKTIPFIYHQLPAQEDLYALFRCCHAKMIGRNISSTIVQRPKLKFTESRKSGIRKAKSQGIRICSCDDFVSFWQILSDNLNNKYGVAPVHTLDEILLLHSRFPQNIQLYMTYNEDQPLGSTLLYLTKQVVHTQYISANIAGKESGALDLLFDYLINQKYTDYPYFDFGQSTEEMGNILNESLIFQKEGFGGRGVTYDVYEYGL